MVPYSSDVLCTHKTRLQLLYTDVQQLKMVQMVSQSQFFRGFYLLYLMRLPIYQKNVRNFESTTPTRASGLLIQNFAQKDSSRLEYVMYNAKALIPCYSWNESTSRTTSWIAWAFF